MKIINYNDVGKLINDGDMVAISGSGGSGSPEALLDGVVNSYLKYQSPKNIGVTCGISPGNLTDQEVGMNKLAKKGLVGIAKCAHLGQGRNFGIAIANNEFPAFGIPLGVINHLYRAIAAKEDGIITHIGLNTFADPRIEGCRVNEKAKNCEDVVELININGKENLFYKTFPINVALIKASYADSNGNLSFEHEAVIGEQYNMAIAAHNSGGIVIAEVLDVKPYPSFKAKDVIIPGIYVDYVVINTPDKALADYNLPYNKKEMSGLKRIKPDKIKIRPLDERKVCGRRALMELKAGDVVNLGVGMPDSVSNAAIEEGVNDSFCLSLETGVTGGVPIGGIAFGASINPDSIIATASQLDAYNGGSLNVAVLGLAQVDKKGNVNVSKLGNRVTGPGGFVNITQNTPKVIFIGTFTASGLVEKINDSKLVIEVEGKIKKFVKNVDQITFSAKNALKNGQDVMYITERAVFKLTNKGLMLIEIAPGIDLNKDVLNLMDFKPIISENLKEMDFRIFANKKMNL